MTTEIQSNPPPYNAQSSPPSYDSVVAKVERLVSPDPSPQKYINVVDTLSESELQVLSSGAENIPPITSEADQEKFAIGCTRALASDDCAKYIQQAAYDAVDATKEIDRVFRSLGLRIGEIDRIHHSGFMPELRRQRTSYEAVLRESRDVATELAIHGNKFDDFIIPFSCDEKIDRETRLQILNGFIADLDRAQSDSNKLEDDFRLLTTNLTEFIASFSTWARTREGQLSVQIQIIEQQLEELHVRLEGINRRLLVVSAGVAIPAFILMAIGLGSGGAFAPFVVIGGLLLLPGAAAIAALARQKIATETTIRDQTQLRNTLSEQIEAIRRSRLELQVIGEEQMHIFANNVGVLSSV
ncbi:hypothetical protein OCU04_010881 [Sclerotinia nivalis]|uniref:Uncharacterized protein n=1 Tax=Sclerotinia nivalis TaxID=352851 RepID=A0A9X0AD49_9HELO|nr:hypothetical protein OCU04_010881 [Sclerotinia nivalis]